MSAEEREVIEECFEQGCVGEDCDDCIAHPSNDPEDECCYGTSHEYHDKQCRRCEYEKDCARLTHGRSSTRNKLKLRTRSTSSTRLKKRRKADDDEPLLETKVKSSNRKRTTDEEAQEGEEEVFMKRLARVTGWGMIEGGLQMALSFFQKNRPD